MKMVIQILTECTKTRVPRSNRESIIGFCAAVLLKFRFDRMSLVQKLVSIILFHGNTSKSVYTRLSCLNICMSYSSVKRLIEKLGYGHDSVVTRWKEDLESQLKIPTSSEDHAAMPMQQLSAHVSRANLDCDSDACSLSDASTSSDTSISDLSVLSFEAPSITSLSPYETSDCEEPDHSNLTATEKTMIQTASIEEGSHTQVVSLSEPRTYRIVGDNMDYSQKARFQRSDAKNKSIHHFQTYAVKDRIDFSHLSSTPPDIGDVSKKDLCLSMLPSPEDDLRIKQNISQIMGRIVCDNVPFFKRTYGDVLNRHIRHKFYSQMSTKSEVVPLGIQLKNEAKGEDMVDIVSDLHQYVPTVEYTAHCRIESSGESVSVPSAVFHPILFGGDQLTAARTRSAQKHVCNADTPAKRLSGIRPMVEDWHTKLTFLEVVWKYFFSNKSASEHCTLYQLRNAINRTNVKSKPKKDFNAATDFFETTVQCHIIAATLTHLNMDDINDLPSSDIVPDSVNA